MISVKVWTCQVEAERLLKALKDFKVSYEWVDAVSDIMARLNRSVFELFDEVDVIVEHGVPLDVND